MHSISSKYRKPKGRPNKRRKAGLQNFQMRNSLNTTVNEDCISVNNAMESVALPDISTPSSSLSVMSDEYCLISKSVWTDLLRNVPCSECKQCTLDVFTHNSFGFSTKLELLCQSCSKSFGHVFTSGREASSKKFDINTKLTSAFLAIGKGHAALEKFSSILGTPCMDRKTFAKCLGDLSEKNESSKLEMLQISREAVKKANIDAGAHISDNIIDITVSYDGTWHKRGHTSLYGIGLVIDVLTNLVVDFHVLSKYCPECNATAFDLGKDSAEFNVWYSGHASDCQKNFDGSSASMEMNAAFLLWKRSITDCQMRYTTILCDGDAKTFLHLNEQKVYGRGVQIEKEECINHVAKRLGTALRNKVKEWRAKGVTLGGRKHGSLTEGTIMKLQNFYRKAIKDNAPDVKKMKTSIFATLFHCMSTDVKPMHMKCPEGQNSWCFYNRAKACNAVPSSHKNMKTSLSEVIVEKIMPVYQRLASDEILLRCVSAKTQNANECLHSCIWRKCSKDVFVSKKRLELAVTAAVKEFNLGYVETLKLDQAAVGSNSLNIAQKQDVRRLSQRKRKSTEQYKKNKLAKKYKKIAVCKRNEKKEGTTYGAGEF